MTVWSTIELAVEAMHRGACDFIPKPWDNHHFLSVVRKHLNAAPDPFTAELQSRVRCKENYCRSLISKRTG